MNIEIGDLLPASLGTELAFDRFLSPDDLGQLSNRPVPVAPAQLKRLSARHHSLARMLAQGMPPGNAAIAVGYAPSRVSVLQSDPAFRELIAHYSEQVDAVFVDMQEALADAALEAVQIIRERLEEEPEKLSTGQLLDIVKTGADRTGNGPSSRSEVDVRVNLGSKLDEARKRVAQRNLTMRPEKVELN